MIWIFCNLPVFSGFFTAFLYCLIVSIIFVNVSSNKNIFDTLSKDAIDEFIKITHEEYKKNVGDSFGGDIPAIFTDEPQFKRKGTFNNSTDKDNVTLPWTDDLPETYKETYGVNTANLNLRDFPSLDGKVLEVIPKSSNLNILAKIRNGWYKVSYRKNTGYVSGDYLKVLTDEEKKEAQLSVMDLTIFENVAYILAKQADPSLPDTPDEWLDSIDGVFSIYQILPTIMELWNESLKTTSIQAKK